MNRRSRVVCRVRGDELFFMNVVATCLQEDHDVTIQISESINIILQHLAENHQEYVSFHVLPDMSSQDCFTKSDLLLNNAMDFFQNRNYKKDLNKQDGHQMVCRFDQVLDQTIIISS